MVASVLAHVLALGALTTLPEHGPSTAAALAERSEGSRESRGATVALVTPPPASTRAQQDPTSNNSAARAVSAGAVAVAVGAVPSDRVGGRGDVPGATTTATSATPFTASSEDLSPATTPPPGGGPAPATGLTRDTVPTAPGRAEETQALASANPLTAPAMTPHATHTLQPSAAARAPAAANAADDDTQPPPVYATRMPPPFRLLFGLRRGALSGQAELVMERAAAGYTLDLKGTALGLEVLGMSSRGALGPNGLMPERFVDRRRGKDRLAANFDHAAGRITYSGSAAAQALWPGGQDRLSWMVQLAAIVEAAPTRYPAGSRIALSVSGARADVDTWTFVVQGRQRLVLPAGAVTDALHLTREPRRPYDTQVEVWLNPAQSHLPARARLTVLPGGETLELSLTGS